MHPVFELSTTLRAVALKNVKCLLIPQLHHFLKTPNNYYLSEED